MDKDAEWFAKIGVDGEVKADDIPEIERCLFCDGEMFRKF